jgi:hypothetical protein
MLEIIAGRSPEYVRGPKHAVEPAGAQTHFRDRDNLAIHRPADLTYLPGARLTSARHLGKLAREC